VKLTFKAIVFPNQTQPRTPKSSKLSHFARVAWRVFITARQFVKQTQKLGYRLVSPGGTGLHYQAVPHRNPENTQNGMHRLAEVHSPPGNFWKISRNYEFKQNRRISSIIILYLI